MKKTILIIALFLGGCMSSGPLISPNSVYHQAGAVVHSPEIGDWTLIQHTRQGVAFARHLEREGGTVIANTILFMVGEFESDKSFLDHIENQREKQNDSKRFRALINKHEQVVFKDVPCLKYQVLLEDHKNNGINSNDFQYLKTMGYICRHPANKSLALQMEFSNKSNEKMFPDALLPVGEAFFRKIQFSDAALK